MKYYVSIVLVEWFAPNLAHRPLACHVGFVVNRRNSQSHRIVCVSVWLLASKWKWWECTRKHIYENAEWNFSGLMPLGLIIIYGSTARRYRCFRLYTYFFPVFLSLLSRFRWQSTLSFRRYDMTELSLRTFSPLVPVIMFIMCSHSPRWLWMCVYCVCESVAMSNRSPSDNSGDEVKVCWARASLTHLHSPFSSSIYIHWFRMVYCYSRIFYVSQDWKCFFFSFASKINSSLYAYRDIHIRCVVTSKL